MGPVGPGPAASQAPRRTDSLLRPETPSLPTSTPDDPAAAGEADPVPPPIDPTAAPDQALFAHSRAMWIQLPAPWRLTSPRNEVARHPGSDEQPRHRCWYGAWFDFLPGSDLAHARRLVATEALEVTSSYRRWWDLEAVDLELAGQPAVELQIAIDTPVGGRIYLVLYPGGTLVFQLDLWLMESRDDRPGVLLCLPRPEALAEEFVQAFEESEPARAWAERRAAPTERRAPGPVIPQPRSIQDCLTELDRLLDADIAEAIRSREEDGLAEYEARLGRELIDRWGLSAGSPLVRYFRQLGLEGEYEMAGLIVHSYWRHLHGLPLNVQNQVEGYRKTRPEQQAPRDRGHRR